ncbi:Gfo/Idh/MocA family protein [Rathayibacter sp. KR2-224]|uniref:Gfo/Idh/MocA family protein n=1 Tax=Rathayibacter sp. KR2-224 TaxID=3400913 RepID=UPI003C1107A9
MTETTAEDARTSADRAGRPPRVAIVGVHGYGAAHVLKAQELQRQGKAELVALVDPVDGPIVRDGRVVEGDLPPIVPSIDAIFDDTIADIVVIATPLHTHAELASRALRAGADVLLEKPPVVDLASLSELTEVQEATGGLVQVGFQSLGSLALVELRNLISNGGLGRIQAIGAAGSWTRDLRYWKRARWAGRREMDGIRVSDGAVSNPFAHAVMTALRIAGWNDAADIRNIETDLYRINEIEVDDTSALRIHPSEAAKRTFDGVLMCAFTLAGPEEADPFIEVRGSEGVAVLHYTEDVLTAPGTGTRRFGRLDLMENLIDARVGRASLLSPLANTGAFVSVIEQVAATPVYRIDDSHAEWQGTGESAHPVVAQVERAIDRALATQSLFRELDEAPWAR